MTGTDLGVRRMGAGISGAVLCLKAGIGRTRLSHIERGYVIPGPDEVSRIECALEELVKVRLKLHELAVASGWPGVLR